MKTSLPGVSIVTRQAGLTVWSLGIVSAVALACLVVTVASERITMAVTLTRNTAATISKGWTKATWTAVLTVGPCSPVWKTEKRLFEYNLGKHSGAVVSTAASQQEGSGSLHILPVHMQVSSGEYSSYLPPSKKHRSRKSVLKISTGTDSSIIMWIKNDLSKAH